MWGCRKAFSGEMAGQEGRGGERGESGGWKPFLEEVSEWKDTKYKSLF